MIAANQWYNIAETDTIGTRTGIRIDFGTKYALFTVSVDYGNSVISAVESNISKEETKLSVRIRQNNNAWYVDVRMSVAQDTTLKAALYENTGGWEAVAPNTSVVGNTICIINDLTSHITPSGGGESLFERINVGTAENPLYAVVPKKYNGVEVGIISNTFMSMAGFGLPDDVPAVAPTLSDLNDVQITEPAAGDVLTYDDVLGTWVNGPGGLNEDALSKYLQDKKYITDTLLTNTLKGYLTVEVYNAGVKEINKKITAVEERIKWFYYDEENNAIHTSCNFISDGTMSMAGVGGSDVTPAVPNITIKLGEVPYDSVNGVVSLPAYPSVGLDENALASYLTTNQYAKKSDIPSLEGYARASDLNTLRTDFDNLYNLLNTDVTGVINTWYEVVDFLDEYSGSEDLATILSSMNTDIARNANNIASNANAITAVSNRMQKFEDVIGIDANGDVYIKGTRNFYTSGGTIGMAGLGSGGGTGGGGTAGLGAVTVRVNEQDYVTNASGIVTIPDYPTSLPASDVYEWAKAATKPSYSFSEIGGKPTTAAGYGIVDALTFTNNGAYVGANMPSSDLSKLAASAYIELWDSAGWWNLKAAKYIVPGGTSSHFLKGDGSLDGTSYLPLSGGTISGNLFSPLIINTQNAGVGLRLRQGGENKTLLAWDSGIGSYIYNNPSGKYIGIKDDGTPTYSGSNTLIHSGNYSSYALPLSGGTITGPLYIDSSSSSSQPLALRSNAADASGACRIQFIDANNAFQGYVMSGWGNLLLAHRSYNQIGAGDSGIWCSSDNGITKNALIHSGNIGNYALKTDGSNAMSAIAYIKWNTAEGGEDYSVYGNGFRMLTYNASTGDYRGGISIGTRYGWQLVRDGYTGTLQARFRVVDTTTWEAWKTIAFTDSNVASATKLQAARTIWGKSFDGTGNVDGNFTMSNKLLIYPGTNLFVFGNETTDTYLRGNNIRLQYGSSAQQGLILNSSGNVLIGTTTNNTTGKLQVAGQVVSYNSNADAGFRAIGSSYSLFFGIGSGNVNRGIYDDANAKWWIYRDATTNTYIPGGNVLIGTTTDSGDKLQVYGGNIKTDSSLVLYTGAVIWLNNGTNYSIQIKDDGQAYYKAYYGHHFYTGSSERMHITSGGNVLIGATTDNGGKLQVNGDVRIDRLMTADDWNAIKLYNKGSWSGYPGYITGVGVYDASGVVGRFGVTFKSGVGQFVVKGLYNGGYDKSGDIFVVKGNGEVSVTGSLAVTGGGTFGGDIISSGTIAMAKLASSSDRKLKDNIAEVSAEQSMSIIRQLRPTTWDWKKDGKKSYGLIAQEVAPIVPEMVVDMGHLHLEYNQLHAFELGAIKHIDSEVDILKRELKKTQKQLKAATKKIGALELQLNDYRRAAICQ